LLPLLGGVQAINNFLQIISLLCPEANKSEKFKALKKALVDYNEPGVQICNGVVESKCDINFLAKAYSLINFAKDDLVFKDGSGNELDIAVMVFPMLKGALGQVFGRADIKYEGQTHADDHKIKQELDKISKKILGDPESDTPNTAMLRYLELLSTMPEGPPHFDHGRLIYSYCPNGPLTVFPNAPYIDRTELSKPNGRYVVIYRGNGENETCDWSRYGASHHAPPGNKGRVLLHVIHDPTPEKES
ncbi:MAG: hypothetical protein AAF621_06675, partial [Pseudomonadota bacterium]